MNVTYGRLMMCPEWMCTVEQSGQDYVISWRTTLADAAICIAQASIPLWPLIAYFAVQR